MVWKLASERSVSDIVCAPGNAGISRVARCIAVDPADPHAVAAIARSEAIDFTIIGPELPLSRGVADVFAAEGDLLFGPTQRAARLESSKVFAKEFMQRCNVPTARYKPCDTAAERELRPDNCEIDLFAAGDRMDGVCVCRINGDASRHAGDPSVAGRAYDVRHGALGREFPHQRVFAPAVSDDQNSRGTHVCVVNSWI